jgi:AmmeMemoRadiSam system protein B
MIKVRPAAVAGMFYPDDAATLKQTVRSFLDHATTSGAAPKAIIVPHAGYVYSGPVAASAYHLLEGHRDQIKRVILLGPSHRVPLLGLAASSADQFSTPLGDIPLDRQLIEQLSKLPQVKVMDEAHMMEHSLEVHLPFLQSILGEFKLVPLVVGDATADEVCEVLEQAGLDEETLIVISSDLSHYHDYATAQRMDRHTSDAIEHLAPGEINYDDACGRIPVSGMLKLAHKLGLKAETVDLRNSGDTAGPKDEVVGYGAYVFR